MYRRSSTTRLPLLALFVALTLLAHDAVMAAGPHDSDVAAGHHDDRDPVGDTACGELVAARTTDGGPDLDIAASPGDLVPLPSLPASERILAAGAVSGDPVAPSRAVLQTWLN